MMKILIREEESRKYLEGDATWVTEPEKGFSFPTLQAAGEKARAYGNCDVVLLYENPRCELALNPVFCR